MEIPLRYNSGYTRSVKTAVSLPDELFRHAELMAKRRRVSRSQLYAEALADFLARNQTESVTEQLNAVYSAARAEVDPGLRRAQLKLLKRARW
jgi:metal-responsive CopG/Arc/MetJ family transcriptional regulator